MQPRCTGVIRSEMAIRTSAMRSTLHYPEFHWKNIHWPSCDWRLMLDHEIHTTVDFTGADLNKIWSAVPCEIRTKASCLAFYKIAAEYELGRPFDVSIGTVPFSASKQGDVWLLQDTGPEILVDYVPPKGLYNPPLVKSTLDCRPTAKKQQRMKADLPSTLSHDVAFKPRRRAAERRKISEAAKTDISNSTDSDTSLVSSVSSAELISAKKPLKRKAPTTLFPKLQRYVKKPKIEDGSSPLSSIGSITPEWPGEDNPDEIEDLVLPGPMEHVENSSTCGNIVLESAFASPPGSACSSSAPMVSEENKEQEAGDDASISHGHGQNEVRLQDNEDFEAVGCVRNGVQINIAQDKGMKNMARRFEYFQCSNRSW